MTTTTADRTYNGWTNRETWAVNLWLDNEEGTQRYWREVAQECWDEASQTDVFTREEDAQFALADRLHDDHEENEPDVPGVYGDLMRAAFSDVNWEEIAGALMESVNRDEETEDAE